MKIILVGGGPSCIALLCYWIRSRHEWFKQQDFTIIEKKSRLGIGELSQYKIRSNSVLPAFRNIIPKSIELDENLKSILDNIGQDFCPLILVSEMLCTIGTVICHKYRNIKLKLNTECLRIEKKTAYLNNGDKYTADHIISAIGGIQTIPDDYYGTNTLLSTTVLNSENDFTGKRIAIIGASHSTWSVVWTLNLQYLKPFKEIHIFSRHKTRVFFRSTKQAKLENYEYDLQDICPETKQIHRFGGLRGDAKETWRNHKNGIYPNIHHTIMSQKADVSGFDIIIIAYNYKRQEIEGDRSYIKFGMMSNTYLECGEPSFQGSKDGIWLYSNHLAEKLTNTILL
jgi:hypothetical protein